MTNDVMTRATPAASVGAFARHYLEMVVAMGLGMMAFGILFVSPLDPLGLREALWAHPIARELGMLAAMSLPMAAWMLFRGHSLERTIEMVAGMAVPSLAVIGLTDSAVVPALNTGNLSLWSHVAMLLGMLGAMLARREEYARPHHEHTHDEHTHHAGHAH